MSISHVSRLSAETRAMPGGRCSWILASSYRISWDMYFKVVLRNHTFWSLLVANMMLDSPAFVERRG